MIVHTQWFDRKMEQTFPSSYRSRTSSPNITDDSFDYPTGYKRHVKKKKRTGGILVNGYEQQKNEESTPATIIPIISQTQANAALETVSSERRPLSAGHCPPLTEESTKYALSRYPFAPFVIRLYNVKYTATRIVKELIDYFENKHKLTVNIAGYRFAHVTSDGKENHFKDLLIFANDVHSLCYLYKKDCWPLSLCGFSYVIHSIPRVPPQLSVVLRDVDLQIDWEPFIKNIRTIIQEVTNVVRMKNKFQQFTKTVKLELTSPETKNILLRDKFLRLDHGSFKVDDYLAPMPVLICSKCQGIGHFMKQCKQTQETCKICGEQYEKLTMHECSNIEKCIHCHDNHKSSALRCPVIKKYRAELTKKILGDNLQNCNASPGNPVSPPPFNVNHFPPLPGSLSTQRRPITNNNAGWATSSNAIDEMYTKMTNIHDIVNKLAEKQIAIDQTISRQLENDESIKAALESIAKCQMDLKQEIQQRANQIDKHEDVIFKIVIPIVEDMISVLNMYNADKKNATKDADLKARLSRHKTQLRRASAGNSLSLSQF